MRTIAAIQYKSYDEMMMAVRTQSIDALAKRMGTKLPSGTYLYANESNQIEAATVATDATPIDEVEFIGRTR